MTRRTQLRVVANDVGSGIEPAVGRRPCVLSVPRRPTLLIAEVVRRGAWLIVILVTLLAIPGIGRSDAATLATCKRDGAAHAARQLKTWTNNCNNALTRNTDWGTGSARKTAYQSCLRNARASANLTAEVDNDLCDKKFPPPPSSSAPVGKAPANEAFCKTLIEQFKMLSTYDPTNLGQRKQYALDQMKLNAKLLQLAPKSIRADVALQVQIADATYAAMAAGDAAALRAAASAVQSSAYLTAARRISQYCNIPVS